MAGTILTGNLALDLIETPINDFFGLAYKDWDAKYDKIFEVIKTDERFHRDILVKGMSIAQPKAEGDVPVFDDIRQTGNITYEAKGFALASSVSHEALEDTHDIKPLLDCAASLKKGAMLRMEIEANNVLDRAFNSSYTGIDGSQMCYTAHATASGATYNNEPLSAADLSEAILEQSDIDILSFIDEADNPAYAEPEGVLFVSKNKKFEAHRVLKSTARYQTADNDANALKDMGVYDEVVTTPYFVTSQEQFFIPTTIEKGLRMFIREAASVAMEDKFLEMVVLQKIYFRLVTGWSDPRGIYGCPGV